MKEVKVIAVAFPDIYSGGGSSAQEKNIEEIILKYSEDGWTFDKVAGGYSQFLLIFTK